MASSSSSSCKRTGFCLAVSKTIQKISKLSDLLLWQLWEAKIQWRVQSLEMLKEALWSLTSQGSKLCIYKKKQSPKWPPEDKRVFECNFGFVCWSVLLTKWGQTKTQLQWGNGLSGNTTGSSTAVVPRVVDSRKCGSSGHRTYLSTLMLFTGGVPVVPVQLLTRLLGFSVYCCFLT
jgi:hypothetical protein